MENKSYAPILLFVYNRPQHTQRAIEALQKNHLADKSELYIYSDAPKSPADNKAVNDVRMYIAGITGFKRVQIITREKNYGLANNIIDGVTTLVDRYKKVIVLEDDLITAPFFLKFMNDALETYKDEPKVGHIQACEFTQDSSLPDTFLIKWTGSWGWGTWDRAWKQYFNPDGKALLEQLKNRGLTHQFDFDGTYGYTKMLKRQTKGENDSWAIRWNASLFLNDILSLNAGKSLIKNEGFDGSGTNCGGGGMYDTLLYTQSLNVQKIVPVTESAVGRRALTKYYEHTNSFCAKVKRRIRRILKGDFGA